MPRLLVDNDVLLKAAHWGLLDFVPHMVGVEWESVSALESLIHRTRRKDKKLFRDAVVAETLEDKLKLCAPIPAQDPAIVARLQGVVGLDAGEVLLISALFANEDTVFLTGDKRALRALADPALADIAARIKGRVLCLEHVLAHAMEQTDAIALATAIAPHRDLDAGARSIVPLPAYATHDGITAGLTSYLNDLANDTNGLVNPALKPPS